MIAKRTRVFILVALAAALGGCVTVFPEKKPARLYVFGSDWPAPAAPAAEADTVQVVRLGGEFEPAAAGDRILTVTGHSAAYVADARWASPASTLFEEAVSRAFAARPGPVRLGRAGERGAATYGLIVSAPTFEARYPEGGGAPMISVDVRASLVRLSDGRRVAETAVSERRAASQNRQAAIVEAFDLAVTDALGQVVDWTEKAASAPASH